MSKPELPATTAEVSKLRQMSWPQLVEVFAQLPCPDLSKMQVEFRDELLQLGHPAHRVLIGGTLNNPLRSWLGKGFRRVDSETGRGYNYFHRPGRGDGFTFPMLTRLSLSALDEQPAFGLIYWAFASPVGAVNMIDEVRRFSDNVYLGFEFCGFTAGQRTVPIPFLLHGPVGAYRGRRRHHVRWLRGHRPSSCGPRAQPRVMASIESRLITHVLLPLMGTKRTFSDTERVRRAFAAEAARPARHVPPRFVYPRVRIATRIEHGWPVYELTPITCQPTGTVVYWYGGAYVREIMPVHWWFLAWVVAQSRVSVIVPIYPLGAAAGALTVVTTATVDHNEMRSPHTAQKRS